MLDDYMNSQNIAYKIIKNASKKEQFSHAYLIEANHYPKKLEFAIAIAKLILCSSKYSNSEKCETCAQCKRIDDGNFTELKIISPDGSWIKKEQLEELQKEFSTKAIETNKKIYIINEAEKMNQSASNSILKFLEEPEEGIIAILITDNMYQLLDTIISRCQVISLNKLKESEIEKIGEKITTIEKIGLTVSKTEQEYSEFIQNEDVRNQVLAAVNYIESLEQQPDKALLKINKLWTSFFSDKEKLSFGLELMIFFYKDVLNFKLGHKAEIFIDYPEKIEIVASFNTTYQLCKKINHIIEAKDKLRVNANNNLLMDQLVLKFQEVANETNRKSII